MTHQNQGSHPCRHAAQPVQPATPARRSISPLHPFAYALLSGLAAGLLLPGCAPTASSSSPAPATTPATAPTTGPAAASLQCRITRIPDGDSLEANCNTRPAGKPVSIRLRGIDAPELRQAYGPQARQRLRQLCQGQTITLAPTLAQDRYGRLLADLQCQNQNAAEYMVRGGFAWYYRATASEYPQLVRMQAQAQRQKLGLWGTPNPTPPWEWRIANGARR